jgi:hypothetical protein
MAPESVELSIPFESLVDSVTKLYLRDKFRLWDLLDVQMADVKEGRGMKIRLCKPKFGKPAIAYQACDYVTIDEYIAGQRRKC